MEIKAQHNYIKLPTVIQQITHVSDAISRATATMLCWFLFWFWFPQTKPSSQCWKTIHLNQMFSCVYKIFWLAMLSSLDQIMCWDRKITFSILVLLTMFQARTTLTDLAKEFGTFIWYLNRKISFKTSISLRHTITWTLKHRARMLWNSIRLSVRNNLQIMFVLCCLHWRKLKFK